MNDLTIYPADIAQMSVSQLAALPAEQKAEISRNLDQAMDWLKRARAKFDASLESAYGERIKDERVSVGKDFGTVGKTHDFGAPRFDASGKAVRGSSAAQGASAVHGLHDSEWSVVGWVTSGGYAHYVGKSMAQGYVPAELADDESAGLFEIEILGQRRPARINIEPPFDPSGEKMRQ